MTPLVGDAPAVVELENGFGVVVPADLVLGVFVAMVREGGRLRRVDGTDLSDRARRLLQALRDADLANSTPKSSVCGTVSGHIAAPAGEWLSTPETAVVMRVSPRQVRKRAQRGDFPGAERKAGRWLIPAASVEEERRGRWPSQTS